jgi:putative heme-binding domain-containing protein
MLLTWALPAPASAAESWADAKLSVRDGLELWLDASRVSGDDAAPADGKVSQWRDASGHGRHLQQADIEARPALVSAGGVGVVRFDGLGDHLRAVKLGSELTSFTLIVVAAPRQNIGGFRGLMALNAAGARDYESGLTVDLGPAASPKFSSLNVEGRGFTGARNLRNRESPFGRLHTLAIASDAATKTIRLNVDGQWEGERPRDGTPISFDEITVGARFYTFAIGQQQVNGFGRSDIAELLLFSRVLTPDELARVEKYIDEKYAEARDALPPDAESGAEALETVENVPPVQVLLPGFSVRELPVELSNINNVKYRPDRTLVALGYDGRVWLLRDTDGDSIEDKAELFWGNESGLRSPIGMDLTPAGYQHGDGVFVAGKTRCLLIVDADGDDRADKEIDVASGWKESFHQVDGLGVAFDPRDGSVYYGRGTYNFADPFLRDKDGKSQLSLTDESGAVIRVSPDFKTREIVATGIRFPVALRFNPAGDLFATDQEGATWLANGNPFDELLHVQRGRHYGFPPRHPTYLPGVIDEPSTFDYVPQHQSTCGLNFNVPVQPDGPVFGPAGWAGDALVAGYSRGKLYRTQLVKTLAGYVARTQLLACLKMLTVDACVSPEGDLVIACHSGGPDWGSGPTGAGKLFKVQFADRAHPQPVLAWAAGPRELRVEFDRAVDPELLRDSLAHSKLTAGAYVSAGDRFESLWPGYAAVQLQKLSPRMNVPVRSAQLTPDGRTLVLATDPMTRAVRRALQLPGMGRPPTDSTAKGELPQHAAIDVDFDLSGCEATWTPDGGGPGWPGWLPHLDLDVSRQLTAGSSSHDALWKAMAQPGMLTLRGQLDLTDMLRPALQPGSRLDHEFPPEAVTVSFAGLRPESTLQLKTPSAKPAGSPNAAHRSFTVPAGAAKLVPFELRLKSGGGSPTLTVSWTTNEDDRPRALSLRRLLVPWARADETTPDAILPTPAPELAGGSWARGYREFFGAQAACSKCHMVHGRGGSIGPDLSNLVHRDYASVLRDISQPSYALNPDHLTYVVALASGRTLSGVIHTTERSVSVSDVQGITTTVDRAEVEEIKASPISTMPEGLPMTLGPDRTRDLMTFLLTPPPQMPRDGAGPRPKPRTLAAVKAALAGAPDPPAETRPIRVLLVAGPKDHGPGEHDYPAWQRAWKELLGAAADVDVATAWEWPTADQWQRTDVAVFYQDGDWNAQRAAAVDDFLGRGGGLVFIHWAVHGRAAGEDFARRIGLAARDPIAFRHGDVTLKFNRATAHPIIRNFESLDLVDETYWKLAGALAADRVLASAVEEEADQPQIWTVEPRRGRIFVSIPGHYSWTFDDPLFRVLLLRGIAWAAREPVDRFNDLVLPGAEIAK